MFYLCNIVLLFVVCLLLSLLSLYGCVMILSSLLFISEAIDAVSRLPLFLQVVLAVIVVGVGFAILKKFVKLAIWLALIALAIFAYQMYFK